MEATKHCRENASIFDVSHMCGLTLKVLPSFYNSRIIEISFEGGMPILSVCFGSGSNRKTCAFPSSSEMQECKKGLMSCCAQSCDAGTSSVLALLRLA